MRGIMISLTQYGPTENALGFAFNALFADYPYHSLAVYISPDSNDSLMDWLKAEFPDNVMYNDSTYFGTNLVRGTAVCYYAYTILFGSMKALTDVKDLYNTATARWPIIPIPENKVIDYYYIGVAGLQRSELSVAIEDSLLLDPDLYPDIDIKSLVRCFSSAKEKILILHGSPGTGKSSFIKYLSFILENKNKAYTKDNKCLVSDDFWSSIIENDYDFLFLDDVDAELTPRTKRENQFISKFLSFSDGILENKCKTIITSNMPIDDIDEALVRPGRCYDIIKLNPLSFDFARTYWIETKKMDVGIFDAAFVGNKEISQAELMSLYNRITKDHVLRPYIKKGSQVYSLKDKITALKNGKYL